MALGHGGHNHVMRRADATGERDAGHRVHHDVRGLKNAVTAVERQKKFVVLLLGFGDRPDVRWSYS